MSEILDEYTANKIKKYWGNDNHMLIKSCSCEMYKLQIKEGCLTVVENRNKGESE